MPYNFAAESFHTKKLCSRLSSTEVDFWREKDGQFTFLSLGATYAFHLRLIGKLVVYFLLVMIELFSLGAFISSQFTCLTDRQTDGLLVAIPRLHSCSTVKMTHTTINFNTKLSEHITVHISYNRDNT